MLDTFKAVVHAEGLHYCTFIYIFQGKSIGHGQAQLIFNFVRDYIYMQSCSDIILALLNIFLIGIIN